MFRHGLLPLRLSACLLPKSRFSHLAVRHGSLNSAIERGLRKSQWVDRPAPRYPRNDRTDTARESYKSKKRALERAPAKGRRDYKPRGGTPEREPTNVRRDYKPRRQMPEEEYPDSGFDEEEFLRTGLLPSMARTQPQPPRNKGKTSFLHSLSDRQILTMTRGY